MKRKILLLCGVFSPLLYIAMTIVGGGLRPDYSHIYHAVSELLEAGAPNKCLMDSILASSNILGILFGVGVLLLVRSSQQKRQIGLVGASCLLAIGLIGLLITAFFPMEPRHLPMTFPGLMHLILVGVLFILSILTPVLMGIWLKKQANYAGYGTYSFISAILIIVTGVFAAAMAVIESPIMGVAERLTIGANLQWTFFIALKMYTTDK